MQEMTNFFQERKKLGIQLGLERIKQLLNELDNPEQKLKAIHVAGTNGKGSTINFINHALIANGYQVGVFTSPSFEGLTGHILMNGKKISDQQFLLLFNDIYPVVQSLDQSGIYATEFEIITAIAFLYFASHADIALIETGMGGRDDTTNCFQPILSIITNVDNDHANFLGKTLKEIAFHKAGIIKHKVQTIVGDVDKEAFTVMESEAKRKLAPLYLLGKDFTYEIVEQKGKEQIFIWRHMDKEMKIRISMLGDHQVINCSLALMALQVIEENGINLHLTKTIDGVSSATLPGRFEKFTQKKQTIILDGAHNIASIQSFIKTVETNYQHVSKKHLIFTAFQDKNIHEMLYKLIPHFSTITLTTFNHPRAMSVQSLKNIANSVNTNITFRDLSVLMDEIKHVNYSDDRYYFFTGSLHFIAYIRKLLTNDRDVGE